MIRSALRRLGLMPSGAHRTHRPPPIQPDPAGRQRPDPYDDPYGPAPREPLAARSTAPRRALTSFLIATERRLRRIRGRARRTHQGARLVSPLMRRILLVNALPLAILAVTLLFLNDFQNSLLESRVGALREQAHIYAGALGENAVTRTITRTAPHLDDIGFDIDPALARPLLVRLTEPSPDARAILYGPDGRVIADSRADAAAIQTLPERGAHRSHRHRATDTPAPPAAAPRHDPEPSAWSPPHDNALETTYDWLLSLLPLSSRTGIVTLDTPDEAPGPRATGSSGPPAEMPPYIRRTRQHQLVVTVTEPVIHDGETIGIIQLTRQAAEVDRSLFAVRSSILSLFLVALAVTVFLSWYLSLTIARPLLRLAISTHDIRDGAGRADTVPETLLARRDEIGELARSLRASALALWARMDANERFAADVSHEIKNPLSSIRSAIETLPRIENTERRERLLGIINNDVRRLDRLITDISDASRVDAELSRTRAEPIAVTGLLAILVDIHQTTRGPHDAILRLAATPEPDQSLCAWAVEDRLVQVLRNLIGNAISFSPPDGLITLTAQAAGAFVEISVADQGPGIPEGKLETIFDRFYSERPNSEKFGQHSGLGLAISRQIIEALRGTLHAENLISPSGQIVGARFVVRLPRAVPTGR
ncbi:sensor histidine kinase [Tanticharoenia sakaeratensis]|uniref:histidine kinase n=1 Tax=Tanticharoenia sakaeratensis NBRC 103193 TaxID=1231623 RepID=A0A0D6MN12_9PROT|nr:sensor histidine kinase [Tanticharoenia sakaeratensis]GAN54683.1 histidine kinase sensory protein [Tanticharoenia sakaeratensis NBRC 103193]GBQ16801.1 two component sensor histidine kinase ChvG [Tanticharoenia sakaeratensis NBRC 103193]